jgi:hypothetical protein
MCRSLNTLSVPSASAGASCRYRHDATPLEGSRAASTEHTAAFIFLDTEFTDFASPELLSLGMASYDGREIYVELDRGDPANRVIFAAASEFVRWGGVLDQWERIPGAAVCARDMGKRAGDWLKEMVEEVSGPLTIAFDYRTDYELLMQSLETAWPGQRLRDALRPMDVAAVTDTFEAQHAAEAAFDQLRSRGLARHHALADALALRAAYVAGTTLRGDAL